MDSRDELRPAGFDDRPLEDRGASPSVDRGGEPEDRPSSATALDPELPPRRGTRRRTKSSGDRKRGSRRREERAQRPRLRPLPILVLCVLAVSALAGTLVWFDPDQTSSAGSEPVPEDTQVLESSAGDNDEDSSTSDQANGSATAVGSTSMQEAAQEEDTQDDEAEGSEDEGQEESSGREDDSPGEDERRRPPGRGNGGTPPGHDTQCRDYDEWDEWLQREYDQKGWEDWMADHC